MKAKGKCLICATKLPEDIIPPERTKIYQNLTQVFIRCLSSEFLETTDKSLREAYGETFRFCKRCQAVATKLYRKHCQLQSGLTRIRRILTTVRGQRILCETEKRKCELFLQSDELNCATQNCTDVTNTDEEFTDSEEKQECEHPAEEPACDGGEILSSLDISSNAQSQDHCQKDPLNVIASRAKDDSDSNTTDSNGKLIILTLMTHNVQHLRTDFFVGSPTAFEDCSDGFSDSNSSPAHETDSDSSYEVSSDSSDEDFRLPESSAPRNQNSSKKHCGEGSRRRPIPPTSPRRKSNFEKSDEHNNSSQRKRGTAINRARLNAASMILRQL